MKVMKYRHLNKIDRLEIQILREKWYSLRQIWKTLKFSNATISREIKRNSTLGLYEGKKAEHKKYVRRRESKRTGMKISWNSDFRRFLEEKLKLGRNPLVVAKVRSQGNPWFQISHTSIYKFLYSGIWNNLCKFLASERHKPKKRICKLKKEFIKFRTPIENRPLNIEKRLEYGHFEVDLIVSKAWDKSCFLTLIDRKTRLLKAKFLQNKSPLGVKNALREFCDELKIKSLTFDNGFEFRLHYEIWVPTYFCNPYSSWEKWSIENANKMIRRYVPKSAYLKDYSDGEIKNIVERINNIPRKILDFKSPNEIFLLKS